MGDGFYIFLEKIEPFLPSEDDVSRQVSLFSIMDANAIHDKVMSNKMVRKYFSTIVQLADGLSRDELSESIVNFLFIHYPSIMEDVSSDNKKSTLFINALSLFLDDLCPSSRSTSEELNSSDA